MKLGFLYAGQGAQHSGMGADLYEKYPAFRAALDGADAGFDVKTVSFTDPNGVLNETEYTQPCMVAFAVGLTDVLAEKGIVPAAAAGLSLGEYSALYAAGVLDGADSVKMVAFRGKAMTDAAKGVESAMMAVLGAGGGGGEVPKVAPGRQGGGLQGRIRLGRGGTLQLQLPGPDRHRRREGRC